MKLKNSYKHYKHSDVETIIKMFEAGVPVQQIGEKYKRTPTAIAKLLNGNGYYLTKRKTKLTLTGKIINFIKGYW